MTKITDLPICFILAKGRSGTTLLQTMLDAHPNTVAPFESRFIVHFFQKYHTKTSWTDQEKMRFIDDILQEQKIRDFWDIDIKSLRTKTLKLPHDTTYGQMCQQVYTSFISPFKKKTAKIIIDKDPVNIQLIPHIQKVFPQARYIHLVRDYRSYVSSYLKLLPREDVKQKAYDWLNGNLEAERFKELHPDKFLTITYENLIGSPKQILHEVTAFLEIEYDPQMMLYHEKMENIANEFLKKSKNDDNARLRKKVKQHIHNNLMSPINPALGNQWKNRLNQEQVKVLESICGSYGSQFGYKTQGEAGHGSQFLFYRRLKVLKLQLYYRLPIWLRELKAKPDMAFFE